MHQLASLATVKVISPIAVYPRWAQPRSYMVHAPQPVDGLEYDVEYVPYAVLPGVTRPFNGWLCGRAIKASLTRFEPDVVLAYWLYPDAYAAMLAARHSRVPLVVGARGSDIRVRDFISKHLTRRVVRRSSRLLAVSEDLGRLAVHGYGADARRVSVIPNGCDSAIFHLDDRAAARHALGVSPDTELVLYVGRLVAEKGLRELLDALQHLSLRRPRLELVIVGAGPMQDELCAQATGHAGFRMRLAGAQPPASVAQWMVAADLLALPSYSEGYPNALIEALACGRPVVATAVGGIPEIVDASCGVLVNPRDSDALAKAIAQVLEQDWDEQALSRRFSRAWKSVAEETLQKCSEALAESHEGH